MWFESLKLYLQEEIKWYTLVNLQTDLQSLLMLFAKAGMFLPRIKRASTTTSETIVKRSVCMNAALYGHCEIKREIQINI